MERIRMTVIAFALFACVSAAGAVERPSDPLRNNAPKGVAEAFYACVDHANFNEIEEAYCTSQERTRQEKRLNTSYQALLRKLNGGQKKRLVEAERAWIKLQDATGPFEESLYGHEIIDNLQLAQNELFAVTRRADQLDEYLAVASGL
ncbi:lysozyme inhibitor LprI family protein [Frateuria sp. GZRe12]|uniref:lysozyme inhibitor LprI family protein n=1 Tax=Frateuria sp. GZRe12 TaxID=3351533 RepID=UPI003EDB7DC2